jgi:hypothetical protein
MLVVEDEIRRALSPFLDSQKAVESIFRRKSR